MLASAGREASMVMNLLMAFATRDIKQSLQCTSYYWLFIPAANPDLYDLAGSVVAVLDHAKTTDPIFMIGHTLGNRVVCSFAHHYPDQVRALTLLAVSAAKPGGPSLGITVNQLF